MIRKRSTKIQVFLTIEIKFSIRELVQQQLMIFKEHNINISMKNTRMEYIDKIGFLIGRHNQLVSIDWYQTHLEDSLILDKGLIEIRKEYTCEKNMKLKVLMIYAVETQVQDIDDSLLELVDTNLKCISYKHTTSAEQLTSMHANECKNIKA